MPSQSTSSTVVLQLIDKLLLAPSDLGGQVSQGAELAEVLEPDDLQGIRDDEPLLGIVGSWDSFEDLELA